MSKESKQSIGDMASSEVHVVLSSNWGDPSYLGLTGIALLETGSQKAITLRPDQVSLLLSHKAESDSNGSDVGALVDGVNKTTDAAHMWACPLPNPLDDDHTHNPPTLVVRLDEPRSLRGLRVWNYNASLEDTYKGVRYHLIV